MRKADAGKGKPPPDPQHSSGTESLDSATRGIAHDLNNLLAVVLGHAELVMRDQTLAARVRTSIEEITKAARSGEALVGRLRALSDREAGGGAVKGPDRVNDAQPGPADGRLEAFTGKRGRILYLDDDAPLVKLAVGELTKLGYSVSGFVRGGDALAALRQDIGAFDWVVTDYSMPGMSGLDFAAEVTTLRPDLPVLVISGAVGDELRADCLRLGVREVIEKPMSVRDLCSAIHTIALKGRSPA